MAREYIIFHKNGDGSWHELRAEAQTPEQAIESAATDEGEYFAILAAAWQPMNVAVQQRLSIVRESA
jgi:hypothetical protein